MTILPYDFSKIRTIAENLVARIKALNITSPGIIWMMIVSAGLGAYNFEYVADILKRLDSPTITQKVYNYLNPNGLYDSDSFRSANLDENQTISSFDGLCGIATKDSTGEFVEVRSQSYGKCPSIASLRSSGYTYRATVEDLRPAIQEDGTCGRAHGTPNQNIHPDVDSEGNYVVPTINGKCPTNRELKAYGDFNYIDSNQSHPASQVESQNWKKLYTDDFFHDPAISSTSVQTPIRVHGQCGLVKDRETGDIFAVPPKDYVNGICYSETELNQIGYEYVGTIDNVRPNVSGDGSCGKVNLTRRGGIYDDNTIKQYLLSLSQPSSPVSFREVNEELYISPLPNGTCPSAGELMEAKKYLANEYDTAFYLEYDETENYIKSFRKYFYNEDSDIMKKFYQKAEPYLSGTSLMTEITTTISPDAVALPQEDSLSPSITIVKESKPDL